MGRYFTAHALSQIYRRVRYQGIAQWITIILGICCICIWMLTTPLSLFRPSDPMLSRQKSRTDIENDDNSEKDLSESGDSNTIDGEVSDSEADVWAEGIPIFSGPRFWDGVDWEDPLELPDYIFANLSQITVETGEEDVEVRLPTGQMQVITVFYRESVPKSPPKLDILLLHGSRYNSETWVTVDSTKTLAAMGYRATAIDLPGFGKTAGSILFGPSAVMFLENFCIAHEIKKPVIVAPSMSGGYAIPYLLSRPFNVTAFVALGPTSTEKFKDHQFAKLQVPLMNVYGSKDKAFGSQVAEHLSAAPNSETRIIEDAFHTPYLDQPEEWHRICYIFLTRLQAWWVKQAKENITTTAHPPVITQNQQETEAPEVTFPPLNVPPIKSLGEDHPQQLNPVGQADWARYPKQTDSSGNLRQANQPQPKAVASLPSRPKQNPILEYPTPHVSNESLVILTERQISPLQKPSVSDSAMAEPQIRPLPSGYPLNGFLPPNPSASQIRAGDIYAQPQEKLQNFEKFQQSAAIKAISVPKVMPDVRPVPPLEDTKMGMLTEMSAAGESLTLIQTTRNRNPDSSR